MTTDNFIELRDKLIAERKKVSLPKIAIASNIAYRTISNIVNGINKKITSHVAEKLNKYFSGGKIEAKPEQAVKKVSASVSPTVAPMKLYFGKNMSEEIVSTRARLNYLLAIEKAEQEYFKEIRK